MPSGPLQEFRPASANSWLISSLGNLSVRLSGLFAGIILAHALGVTGRGIAAEAALWPTAVLACCGIINVQSVAYFTSRFGARGAQTSLFLAAVLAVLLLPTAWGVNILALGVPTKASLASANLYAWVVPFTLLGGVFSAALLSEGRIGTHQGVAALAAAVVFGGTLALALLGKLTPFSYAGAAVLGSFVAMVTSALLQRTVALTLPVPTWSTARAMVLYGSTTTLVILPYQLNFRLDQLLMSLMTPTTVLGNYVVAVAWSSTLSVIGGGIATVTLSQSVRMPRNDVDAMRHFAASFRLAAILMVVGGCAAAAAAPLAVPFLFGRDFQRAVPAATILSIASIPLYLTGALHHFVRGLGFPALGAIPELAGLALSAMLLPFLLPRYGGIGAACASLLSYSLIAALLLYRIGRHVPAASASDFLPQIADLAKLRHAIRRYVVTVRRTHEKTPR